MSIFDTAAKVLKTETDCGFIWYISSPKILLSIFVHDALSVIFLLIII